MSRMSYFTTPLMALLALLVALIQPAMAQDEATLATGVIAELNAMRAAPAAYRAKLGEWRTKRGEVSDAEFNQALADYDAAVAQLGATTSLPALTPVAALGTLAKTKADSAKGDSNSVDGTYRITEAVYVTFRDDQGAGCILARAMRAGTFKGLVLNQAYAQPL